MGKNFLRWWYFRPLEIFTQGEPVLKSDLFHRQTTTSLFKAPGKDGKEREFQKVGTNRQWFPSVESATLFLLRKIALNIKSREEDIERFKKKQLNVWNFLIKNQEIKEGDWVVEAQSDGTPSVSIIYFRVKLPLKEGNTVFKIPQYPESLFLLDRKLTVYKEEVYVSTFGRGFKFEKDVDSCQSS